jgi:hypothetical protein
MTVMPIFLIILFSYGLSQENLFLMNWSLGLIIFFGLTFWLINIIWAVVSVRNYNKEIEYENNIQLELWEALSEKEQGKVVKNVGQKSHGADTPERETTVSSKPSLKDWAKENPGKSINDYYKKFGR